MEKTLNIYQRIIEVMKEVKYIQIHTHKSNDKRMKDITFVENVDICWNKYKYQKELKYNERGEIR